MTPAFNDPAARRRWDAYFAEVDRLLAAAGDDADGLADDFRAHAADSMAAQPDGREIDRLDAALTRLGRPADYLHPLIADRLLDRGTRSYRPMPIARGLFHAVLAGSTRAATALLFGLGYLLIAIFAAIAVLKPFLSGNVGLFRNSDGSISAGIVAPTDGAQELLGWWSIPLALALAVLLYLILTRALRAFRTRR